MPTASSENQESRPTTATLIGRSLRLCCPTCGQGKLFRTFFSMNDPCRKCQRKFEREPGFWLGSIYFNYGVTALLVVIMYFVLFFTGTMTGKQLLVVIGAFALLFPLWFFRYARALWLAFDEKYDPWPQENIEQKTSSASTNVKS